MNTKKMESLKQFKVSKEQMKNTSGGVAYGWGLRWIKNDDISFNTGDIGTYVDGMSMGTDGHED